MKKLGVILLFIVSILFTACEDEFKNTKSALVGSWRLYQIYDGVDNWIQVDTIFLQILKMKSDEKYEFEINDIATCKGDFFVESESTVRFEPNDCIPIVKSVEDVKELTADTLIITDRSNSISSYYGGLNKYYRVD